jgi:hypothetical protein
LQYEYFTIHQETRHLRALTPDTFILFCFEHIGVFRVPNTSQNSEQEGVTTTIPVLQPLWWYDFDKMPLGDPQDGHPVSTRPFQIDDDHMHMNISVQHKIIAISVPLYGNAVKVVQQLELGDYVPLSEQATLHTETLDTAFGHAWICAPSWNQSLGSHESSTCISLHPRPLLEVAETLRCLRVGVDPDPEQQAMWSSTLVKDGMCVPITINHDEWTGIVMVESFLEPNLDPTKRVSSTSIWQLGRRAFHRGEISKLGALRARIIA